MFEKILEYQKLDGQILALKRSLEKDEAKVALNKVIVMVKDAQTKLLELKDLEIMNILKKKIDQNQ